MLQVVSARILFMTRGIAYCLKEMMLLSEIWKRRMMFVWFAGRMLGTHLKDGFVWIASSLMLLESPLVSKVNESSMLSKSKKLSICPSPFSLRRSPARVIVQRGLQGGSVREVQRLLHLCPSTDLSSAMSQLCYPKDGGCTLLTPLPKLPWKLRTRLLHRAERIVVLLLSSNRALVNVNINFIFLQLHFSI